MERKIIASTFDALLTVFERKAVEGSLPRREELFIVYKDIPCALSRSNTGAMYLNQRVKQGLSPEICYEIKLFLGPEFEIKPGSFLKVKTPDWEREYISCGEAIKYKSHQEILLSREDFA